MIEAGKLVALLGDLEAGQAYYWEAIALSPNDPRYVREFLKFSIRFHLNLSEVALPVARQLVLLNPEDPASLDVMGDVLLHLRDYLNAERFYLRALKFDPDYDQAHMHLGGLYRLRGEMELAEDHYRQALALTTNGQTISLIQEILETYFSP
jgi:tetratricopeptide (TPR) repeat protein